MSIGEDGSCPSGGGGSDGELLSWYPAGVWGGGAVLEGGAAVRGCHGCYSVLGGF